MIKIFAVLLLASASIQLSKAAISAGSCPKSPILPDFQPASYVGSWYQIEAIEMPAQKGFSCVKADYDLADSNSIGIRNSGYNP